MYRRSWDDLIEFDVSGRMIERVAKPNYDYQEISGLVASGSVIETHPNSETRSGSLDTEAYDLIPVNLVAGQTYSFAYRGTVEGGIEDPYLALFNPALSAVIAEDDDGGQGRSSQITYTATETGTFYLYATSWYHIDPSAPGYPNYRDAGDYTVNIWSPDPAHDAPDSLATTFELNLGTNYAYIDAPGDADMYAVNVEAGSVYAFTYSGGVSSGADFDGEPGENVVYLDLLDGSGNLLGSNLNYESGLSYFAKESGTIYVRVEPYYGTGGYTIDVTLPDPADFDPLEALDWDSAANIPTVDVHGVPTAYVYFAPVGENFGETEPDGVTPMATFGWQQHQIDAVMHGLQIQYTPITGINYVVTSDADVATFRMLTTSNAAYGARFYPQDPAYGDQAGIGTFNLRSGGFGTDPSSLLPGGYSYAVILHEFGHAHGVAHPHDTGGGSEIMLGVTGADSLGVYDLNQGVYTVMSYNDAWMTHPDGERVYGAASRGSGWSETLGAFDIALLQDRYGVHEYNTGNNVYVLADSQAEATYETIWDSAGTDTIAYIGARDVQIDLLAATLDYTPTGGGVVSFADGIYGGYTIANGVVIENATGGSGDDALIGNSAANTLSGNAGDDLLMGRAGNDQLFGGAGMDRVLGGDGLDVVTLGAGNDTFVAEVTETKMYLQGANKGAMSVDIITDFDANGDDLIDLSGLGSFSFQGTDANRDAGDLTYKTFGNVQAAEKALGMDFDGYMGTSAGNAPVTVVYGNVDGGAADFAIVLLNTKSVEIDDFIFA